jgi:hypothetical protein
MKEVIQRLQEDQIKQYLLSEMAAEQLVSREPGGFVYVGEKNSYWVELKLFKRESEKVRLMERDEGLGYD